MTRRTYAYDPDLDAVVQIRGPGSNHPDDPPSGVQIIRDIEPYRTAGSDVAAGGKRIVVGSRSTHREFLSRNGYIEYGNERPMAPAPADTSKGERIEAIRRALGDYGSNTHDR